MTFEENLKPKISDLNQIFLLEYIQFNIVLDFQKDLQVRIPRICLSSDTLMLKIECQALSTQLRNHDI
ncbi:Cleavage and polyadenylation specificity factor subunit 3 [Frankliniella fusca]|uniref:Cleavage and polyadenylation specificity factor subunit 3 n=1 Tax=Frankliniella fusca TaxID=407009 RepID=A0AAE1LF90_9NEOP|nr:Cleavage and polyadenylation specificity factor subunit 3 [Frankliniella fusca]